MKVTQYCHIIYKSSILPCDFIVCVVCFILFKLSNVSAKVLLVLTYMTLGIKINDADIHEFIHFL